MHDRRTFIKLTAVAAAALPACKDAEEPVPAPPAPGNPRLVRVASVPTAVEGNVLPALIKEFIEQTKLDVKLEARPDVYDAARAGKVDLAISHYGHRDAEQFVLDGLGEWPRTVFSNQMALIGPPADPAKIRGLTDAADALKRIAETRSAFLINDLDGVRYLTDILWHAIGAPTRAGWMIDNKHQKEDAIALASKLGAYTLWGLTPFLRTHKTTPLALEPLVLGDPLLQRMLVTIVVKNGNPPAATALQSFLLAPATQAKIRATRYPTDQPVVCWVPGGRHNRTGMLPKV